MKQGQHLLDIMNEVSARLDNGTVVARSPSPEKPGLLDEMQAFMLIDPLLADLHKQYQDARGARLQSEKEYGRADGMTEMAMINEDSAWCAMQTRYMELRKQRGAMARAQDLMEESRREDDARRKKHQERESLQAFEYMQQVLRMREAQQGFAAGWWIVLMWTSSMPHNFFRDHYASHQFNRLAA